MIQSMKNIGFIGAGKVSIAFGAYIQENIHRISNYQLKGYVSRDLKSAIKAASITKTKAYQNIKELAKDVDMLFITTNDDTISQIAKQLQEQSLLKQGTMVIHMSGSLSSEELGDLQSQRCFGYSLHPLQSFADLESSLAKLPETVFTLEGDKDRIAKVKGLVEKLGNKCYEMNKKGKSLYHVAACVASNYLVTLMDVATEFLLQSGIQKEDSMEILKPLIYGTLSNIEKLGTQTALTGPIARGDINTISKHLKNIQTDLPHYEKFYKTMGQNTIELASKEKLKDKHILNQLGKLFDDIV